MSGDLQYLKSSLRKNKVKNRNNAALAREAKKAKLVLIVPPTIPEIIPVTIPPPIQYYTCRVCGDNDPICTTNQLNWSHNSADVKFGRTSTNYDCAYRYVLEMTPGKMINEYVSSFIKEVGKGKPVTDEQIQGQLDSMTTTQIIRKLVKLRRKEDEKNDNLPLNEYDIP